MFGGVIVIVLIVCYILFGMPVLKYYRDHQATPQEGMYMENGDQYISGYRQIEWELQSHRNSYCTWINHKKYQPIYPIDKTEFFSENPDAEKAYRQSMVRAMSWDIGYTPLFKTNTNVCGAFNDYNQRFKLLEKEYYAQHPSEYRNKESIQKFEENLLEKKDYIFTLRFHEYEFDIRSYWDIDPLRYSF